VPSEASNSALRKLPGRCAAFQATKDQEKMNKGLLIVAVPALLVSTFWLTMGWGWRTAAVGACLEMAILIGIAAYSAKRERTP
jgi:hypothetical protein